MKRFSSSTRWTWLTLALAACCTGFALAFFAMTISGQREVRRVSEMLDTLTHMLALVSTPGTASYQSYKSLEAKLDSSTPVFDSLRPNLRTASEAMWIISEERAKLESLTSQDDPIVPLRTIGRESATAGQALESAISKARGWQADVGNTLFRRARLLLIVIVLLAAVVVLVALQIRLQKRDIERRRHAERALRESESRFRELFENVREAVYQTRPDGTIIAANRALVELLGYSSADELKRTANASGLYADPACREMLVEKLEREGELRNAELVLRARDGRTVTVVENARAVRDENGQTLFFEGTLLDITDRLEIEREASEARDKAIAASRLKSEFLANVSHEIRTPMNGVIGMTGLLLETRLTPEQREYAVAVRRSAQFLLGVINDILDFSKIEAGRLELERIEFDVRTSVEDVLELLAEQAESKGIELVCDPADDVPATVVGDPGRLRQIITNLAANAVKFTHHGHVLVSVGVAERAASHIRLRFTVEDTGIGMTAEQTERIFEPFCQGDGSTTRKYGGTGLGLTISRRIAELMGGDLNVTSESGRGSKFTFTALFTPGAPAVTATHLLGTDLLLWGVRGVTARIITEHAQSWGMRVSEVFEPPPAMPSPDTLMLLDPQGAGLAPEETPARLTELRGVSSVWLVTGFANRALFARLAGDRADGVVRRPLRIAEVRDCWNRALAPRQVEPPATPAGVTRTILIAEDNTINQTVARRMLERMGYQVEIAATGRQAIEAAGRSLFDAILMDCQMPEIDGFEATAQIRRQESDGSRVPIIAMTANALQGDRERCILAGMDDYVAKPIHSDDLQAVLSRWLPRAEAVAQGSSDTVEIQRRF